MAGDGEHEELPSFRPGPSAARGHAGRIICRYDIAGQALNSRLCRVPGQGAIIICMSTSEQPPDDVQLLTAALDHAWQWWEFRINNGLQVLNFFLLASAIMVAAYVSALSSHLYVVASAIGLIGAIVSSATFIVGKRQHDVANLGAAPIAELQSRLASTLNIDSLRMVERHPSSRSLPIGGRAVAYLLFPITLIASAAAAAYALFGH